MALTLRYDEEKKPVACHQMSGSPGYPNISSDGCHTARQAIDNMHNFILVALLATVALVYSAHTLDIASGDQLLTRVARSGAKSSEEKHSNDKPFARKVESNEDEEGSGQKGHKSKSGKDSSSSEEKSDRKVNANSEVEGSGDVRYLDKCGFYCHLICKKPFF
ncbi:hypothetical protein KIN20_035907 [Parelaphostrongylus tenuis]|uniref:Uncharacterized protein n=1 Tax=Parelaphostrongylus tenuis TaxID=148309 RepID=A0AAD5RC88_PARTN|nr:hypothetical protein KIN20_035907 [Parelaphostrongylus tenuis]